MRVIGSKLKPCLAAGLLLACVAGGASADPGTMVRAAELKDKPRLDASTTGKVAERAEVDITKVEGAWLSGIRLADALAGG